MFGWQGHFLHVNLTKNKAVAELYDSSFAFNYLGGRGFAAKILWDQLKPGTDPLSPDNMLIFAAGPLTGFGVPNSGKLVVAAKSPLTGGYGDGNIGTNAAVQMRKAGYDAIIVEGKAKNPVFLHVKDKSRRVRRRQGFLGLNCVRDGETVEGDLRAHGGHRQHRSRGRKPRQIRHRRLPRRTLGRKTWNGRGHGF